MLLPPLNNNKAIHCTQQCPPALHTVFLDFSWTSRLEGNSNNSATIDSSSSSTWQSVIDGQLQSWPAALLQQHGCLGATPPRVSVLPCQLTPSELRSSKRGSKAAASLVRIVQSSLQHQQQQLCCQPQQLVLVAHDFGGHLLKEACLQLQHGATDPRLPAWQRQQYACTLHSIAGLVFYSTPHQAVPGLSLPEYEYVLPDMAPVCKRFTALCEQYGWPTLGVGAALLQSRGASSTSVPVHAAAKGMTRFTTVPADQDGVCKPTSTKHPSFVVLRDFLQHLVQERKADKDAAAAAAVMAVFAQGACNGDGSSSSTATIAMPEGAFSGCMRPLKAALVC